MKAGLLKAKVLALAVAMLSTVLAAVYAQTTTTSPYIPELQPQIPDFLKPIVERGLGFLYGLGWVVVIGAGIYGGIEWARGDPEKAKKILGGVIIGGIILAVLPMFIRWLLGG